MTRRYLPKRTDTHSLRRPHEWTCELHKQSGRLKNTVIRKVLPSGMHSTNRLPAVGPQIEPLSRLHTHRPIAAPYTVQIPIQRRNSATASPRCHTRHRRPITYPWVKPFHRRLVVTRIETSQCVDTVVQNSNSTVPTPGIHRRTGRPHRRQRIIPFNTCQTGSTIIASADVQKPVEGARSQT